MNSRSAPYRFLAALVAASMLFGIAAPVVQQACAMAAAPVHAAGHLDADSGKDDTTEPCHAAPQASSGHHSVAPTSAGEPPSEACLCAPGADAPASAVPCCTIQAADAPRAPAWVPSSALSSIVPLAPLTGVRVLNDDSDAVPDRITSSTPLPSSPVRIHVRIATFLN